MDRQRIRYELLKLIERQPDLDQRGLARELGVSLGSTHYLLRALIEKGYIKIGNFSRSRNKRGYVYQLTPSGLEAKWRQAAAFLAYKRSEHAALTEEIKELASELARRGEEQRR